MVNYVSHWGENGNRDIGIYAALAELTSNPTCWIDGNGKFYTTTYTLNQKCQIAS